MADTDYEILNVVDEMDRVIGQRTRTEIHRLGLIHRAVHALVFNSSGRLFLQQRSMSKDRNPGLWDSSAAGHVDAGEDYGDCVVREVREELGIDAPGRFERLFKTEATPETGMEFCTVYRLIDDGPFRLNVTEIQGGGWFSPGEIDSWISRGGDALTSTFQKIWMTAHETYIQ